jgi:hypothetical protein
MHLLHVSPGTSRLLSTIEVLANRERNAQELSGWYAVACEVAHSKLDVLALHRGEGDAPGFQKEISLITGELLAGGVRSRLRVRDGLVVRSRKSKNPVLDLPHEQRQLVLNDGDVRLPRSLLTEEVGDDVDLRAFCGGGPQAEALLQPSVEAASHSVLTWYALA